MALPNLARNNDRDLPSIIFYAGSFVIPTVIVCSLLYFVNSIAGLLWIPAEYAIRAVWCKEAIPISLAVVLIGVGIWTQPELVEQVKEQALAGWAKSKETSSAVAESLPPLSPLGYHPKDHPDSPASTASSPSPISPTALKTKKHHFHRRAASQRHAHREEAKAMKRAATMNEKVEHMAARAEIVEHGGTVKKLHMWDMHGPWHAKHEEKHHDQSLKKHHEAGRAGDEHSTKQGGAGAGLGAVHKEDGKNIEEDGKPYAKAHFGVFHHHKKHQDQVDTGGAAHDGSGPVAGDGRMGTVAVTA